MSDSCVHFSKPNGENEQNVGDNLHTDEYFIVYLDLLGTKDRISDNEDESLRTINTLYSEALTYKKGILRNVYGTESYAKIFSDNIVVAVKVTEEHSVRQNALFFLSYFTSYFQTRALIDHQWLVRGSMTCGNLYICDKNIYGPDVSVVKSNLIWGSALINAYRMEDTIAVYPRVIIDEKILHLGYSDSNGSDPNPHHRMFLKDEDGLYSLDYLNTYVSSRPYESKMIFEKASKSIEYLKKNVTLSNNPHFENKSVIQKIMWTESYLKRALSSPVLQEIDYNPDPLYGDKK